MSNLNLAMGCIEAASYLTEDGGRLCDNPDWRALRRFVVDNYVEMVNVRLRMTFMLHTARKGDRLVRVTKENPKTWIMYELNGSIQPGCRWTIPKSICTVKELTAVDSVAIIPNSARIY